MQHESRGQSSKSTNPEGREIQEINWMVLFYFIKNRKHTTSYFLLLLNSNITLKKEKNVTVKQYSLYLSYVHHI